MSIKVPKKDCIFEYSFCCRKSKSFLGGTVDVVHFYFPIPKPNGGKEDVVWAVSCAWSYVTLYIIPNVGYDSSTFITLAWVSCVSRDMGVTTPVLCFL